MDKATARAKYATSRRGRRRYSRGGRSISAAPPAESSNAAVWVGYEDVVPLEGIEEDSAGKLDYAELLRQEPVIEYSGVFSRGLDPFEDAFADLYSLDVPETSTSSLLSLDLELLGQRLSQMSLKKSLFLDDETLPSELLVSDEEDEDEEATSSNSDDQEQAAESSVDAEEIKSWIDTALRDPDDGKALPFEETAAEDLVPRGDQPRDREAELDALLDLLNNVGISEGDGDGGGELGGGGGGDVEQEKTAFMSEKDLQTLMWAPGDDDDAAAKALGPALKAGLKPPPLDAFDAWLDSFD